jgi:hypothetical protein
VWFVKQFAELAELAVAVKFALAVKFAMAKELAVALDLDSVAPQQTAKAAATLTW